MKNLIAFVMLLIAATSCNTGFYKQPVLMTNIHRVGNTWDFTPRVVGPAVPIDTAFLKLDTIWVYIRKPIKHQP